MLKIKRILKNIVNAILCRDAYVTVGYVHSLDGKILNKFSINIITWNKAHVMPNLTLDDAELLEKTLSVAKYKVEFRKGDSSLYEYIIIPKWAIRMVITDIRRYIL